MQYRFLDCTIDTERREFRRSGEVVPLRRRVYAVLLHLVEQRDRAVSRSELFAHVWGKRIVTDATLSSCIKELRRALGDGGKSPQVIQTLHGHGFRFIAAATTEEDVSEAPKPPLEDNRAAETAREYKQVTVLVGMIPGASRHAANVGPEAMDTAMRGLLDQAHAIVDRYGGEVTQCADDGFVALFGAPIALEDHARRAVQVALELARQLPHTPGTTTLPGMQIGLHSGEVLVGALAIDNARAYTAAGDVTSGARRLCELASPGTPHASATCLRLVADEVQARPVGEVAGTTAFAVESIAVDRGGVPARSARRSDFVGRARELAALDAAANAARGGSGQLVCVVGEAGLGKSRLVEEFRRKGDGLRAVTANCLAHHAATPYMPVATLLRALCGATEDDPREIVAHRLRETLLAADMREPEARELLLALLNVPGNDASVAELAPETRRMRTFHCATRLVLRLAAAQPLLLIVEDLHWIDATSEAWLAELVELLATASVLVVATCRPGYRLPWPASPAVTQIALSPLDAREGAVLVDAIRRGRPLPEEAVRRIVAMAHGNPFFLEELAWALLDESATAPTGGVPSTVQSVVGARIDQLSAIDKQLLRIAAIFGQRIDIRLLGAVSGYDQTALDQALAALAARGFLCESRGSAGHEFAFRHVLSQEVAYHSLPVAFRSRTHQAIAEALERDFADAAATQPEVMGWHWGGAGRPDRAFAYWRRAGHRAIERSAHAEAVSHFRRALEANASLPTSAEIERERVDVLLMLGPALMSTLGFAVREVGDNYQEARDLCMRFATDAQRFVAAWGFFLHNVHAGRIALARELVNEILDLAARIDERGYWLQAHHAGWTFGLTHGDLRSCLEHASRGIEMYEPTLDHGQALLYGMHDPGLCAYGSKAYALWFLGEADRALTTAHETLDLAGRLTHPFTFLLAVNDVMWVRCARREALECRPLAERVIELCTAGRHPNYAGYAGVVHGWARVMLGETDAGLREVHASFAAYCSLELERHQAYLLTLMIQCQLRMNCYDEAHEALGRAQAVIDRTGEIRWAAEVRRLTGVLLWEHRHDAVAAEATLREAMDIAAAQRARMLQLRAANTLASLWLVRAGQPAKGAPARRAAANARDLLQPLLSSFTEGWQTPDLCEARETLAACS
ncbi:MAG: AAA family ATPase [Steroidobacteraceae bacterium]